MLNKRYMVMAGALLAAALVGGAIGATMVKSSSVSRKQVAAVIGEQAANAKALGVIAQNASCQNIVNQCKSAGFALGQGQQGSGLFKNCVTPLLSGKSKPSKGGQPVDVPVNAADVQACAGAMKGA
jgi:hypothetical protein